jgi:hypothetical protein
VGLRSQKVLQSRQTPLESGNFGFSFGGEFLLVFDFSIEACDRVLKPVSAGRGWRSSE